MIVNMEKLGVECRENSLDLNYSDWFTLLIMNHVPFWALWVNEERWFRWDDTLEIIMRTSKCIHVSYLEKTLQVCFLYQTASNLTPEEEEGKYRIYFNELWKFYDLNILQQSNI